MLPRPSRDETVPPTVDLPPTLHETPKKQVFADPTGRRAVRFRIVEVFVKVITVLLAVLLAAAATDLGSRHGQVPLDRGADHRVAVANVSSGQAGVTARANEPALHVGGQ
ncbi:MAG TPA: hypothetical protein VF183_07450 [Acidimicrobiales bacterium]